MGICLRIGGLAVGSSGSSWTPQTEYLTVKAAMTSEPSLADQKIQDKWVKDLLLVWDKAIVLDNFSCPDSQSSLLNWKTPGTCNPSIFNAAVFTAYKGIKGSNSPSRCVNLNFIPSVDGAGFLGQDDICIIIGINEEVAVAAFDFGNNTNTKGFLMYSRGASGGSHWQVNSAQVNLDRPGNISKRYFAVSRNNGANFDLYSNLVKNNVVSASIGLCDTNLVASGILNGASFSGSGKITSFALIFKYLTESEVQGAILACDNYLANYSNNIRTFQRSVYFNLVSEGHSFMISNSVMPDCLEGKINTLTHNVLGVGGNKIAQMAVRSAIVDALLVVETATLKNILAVFCGVNDVSHTAGQGATYYAQLKAYVQARATAGWKVFVYTLIASNNVDRTGAYHAQWVIEQNIFNNSMRTDLVNTPNVYIMDTDTIPVLTEGTADYTGWVYYNPDSLHLASLGALLASELFKTKMVELYG